MVGKVGTATADAEEVRALLPAALLEWHANEQVPCAPAPDRTHVTANMVCTEDAPLDDAIRSHNEAAVEFLISRAARKGLTAMDHAQARLPRLDTPAARQRRGH